MTERGKEKIMEQNELNEILAMHQKWLSDSHLVTKHGLPILKEVEK